MQSETKPNKIPILIIGDAVVATGFSRILRTIFGFLHPEFEIHHLAVGYNGDPHDYPWPLYPAYAGGERWGIQRLPGLIEAIRPRLVFVLNDIWVQGQYMEVLRQYLHQLKVILYIPIDSGPVQPELAATLGGAHRIVVFTEYSKRILDQALIQVQDQYPSVPFPEINVMPLGVDTDIFRPLASSNRDGLLLPNRAESRRILFGEPADDMFVVLNANRNQMRKRIDITVKAFALFAADKPPNVRLYLHMGLQDLGWNIMQLAQLYQIQDRLIVTGQSTELPIFASEQLNLIYNVCDVGINTSIGESWGMVSFEHGATCAAQVVPDHSACKELWTGSAELLDPIMSLTNPTILTEEQFISPQTAADALERLYQDRDYLLEMSNSAYQNATQFKYQWANIANSWQELFTGML